LSTVATIRADLVDIGRLASRSRSSRPARRGRQSRIPAAASAGSRFRLSVTRRMFRRIRLQHNGLALAVSSSSSRRKNSKSLLRPDAARHVAVWTLGLSVLLGHGRPQASRRHACRCFHRLHPHRQPHVFHRDVSLPALEHSTRPGVGRLAARLLRHAHGPRSKRNASAPRKSAMAAPHRRLPPTSASPPSYSRKTFSSWLIDSHWFSRGTLAPVPIFAVGRRIGRGRCRHRLVRDRPGPRWSSAHDHHFASADPGVDGAISIAGTLAGIAAASHRRPRRNPRLRGDASLFWISTAGATFGLLFDSLLGATLERRGWLNNDAVNFLSTASAAAFALGILAILPHAGVG
jgi:hypothetical protein